MEDPYQDEVPESVAALREEGYRIMMVTGDSEFAAENIAYATGLAVRGYATHYFYIHTIAIDIDIEI